MFASLSFPPELFGEFLQTIKDTCALVSAGVPQNLIDVVSNLASNSFLIMRGISGLVHYNKGTGAGTPTADLLFTFLMVRVLKSIHAKLVAADLIPVFHSDPSCFFKVARSGSVHIMGASLIDDTFFNAVDADPLICVSKSTSIAAIVFDEFALHSLDVNSDKGKTEFTLDLIGPGSKQILADIMSLPEPHIIVCSRFYGGVPVHACHMYKHMGSKHNAGYSKSSEIKCRSDSALGAVKEVGHMLRSPKLDCKTKLCLARSLSLSRLRYNVASIQYWQKSVFAKFSTTYFRVIRNAVLMRSEKNLIQVISNSRLCAKHVIPPPSAYLSKLRLKYLHRVCVHAPFELKSLIWADYIACPKFSCLGLCFSDLVWLTTALFCLRDLPDPFVDCMPWYSLINDLSTEFFKYSDNAVESSCFSVPDPVFVPKVCTVICDLCGAKAANPQELSAHKWLVPFAKSTIRIIR